MFHLGRLVFSVTSVGLSNWTGLLQEEVHLLGKVRPGGFEANDLGLTNQKEREADAHPEWPKEDSSPLETRRGGERVVRPRVTRV